MSLEALYRRLNRKAAEKEKRDAEAKILAEVDLKASSPGDQFRAKTSEQALIKLFEKRIPYDYRPPMGGVERGKGERSVNSKSAVEDANRITRRQKS